MPYFQTISRSVNFIILRLETQYTHYSYVTHIVHLENIVYLDSPPGGALKNESDVHAYRRTKIGGIQRKTSSKKGVIPCGHQKVWTPKNGGHSVCKNAISRQNLQIFCLNCYKIVKFLKMRAKRAKICNFYVKFDTMVEKRGSLGVD